MSFDPHGTVATSVMRDAANSPSDSPPSSTSSSTCNNVDDSPDLFRQLRDAIAVHDLPAETVVLAEELSRLQWTLGDGERRALCFAILASFVSVSQGSTRLPLSGGSGGYLGSLIAAIAKAGNIDCNTTSVLRDIHRLVRGATFDRLIGGETETLPFIVDGNCLYQQRLHRHEISLCQALGPRLAPSDRDSGEVRHVVDDVAGSPTVLAGKKVTLSDEQRLAVERALARRFAVISGGPGTGKTAIAVALLRTAVRLGVTPSRLGLAAPTGKAAHRLGESLTGQLQSIAAPTDLDRELESQLAAPTTLHRFLGYSPRSGGFRYHAHNLLPFDFIVVDEASMVDLILVERLLRAMSPTCTLILLGDADQLPSVDAGAVLRDLVLVGETQDDADKFGFRLTRNFRVDDTDASGRQILSCAEAVNSGDTDSLLATKGIDVRRTVSALTYAGAELLEATATSGVIDEFLRDWHHRCVVADDSFKKRFKKEASAVYGADDLADGGSPALKGLMAAFGRHRLLTATRRLATGVDNINRYMHRLTLAELDAGVRSAFYPGEPIVVRRNDYRRGLLNGDQGVVVRYADADNRHHFAAAFPRQQTWLVFPLDSVRSNIELGYAMTVHRSQGSEWDRVALLLPTIDLPLLSRQLIYTAATRARRSVVMVGRKSLLRAGVNRSTERFSGIADRLDSEAISRDPTQSAR